MTTTSTSFVANVNYLVRYLEDVISLNTVLDVDRVNTLLTLANLDLDAIEKDLSKSTYLGQRKININLLTNYEGYSSDLSDEELSNLYLEEDNLVRYSSVTLYFTNGTISTVPFVQNNAPYFVTTNSELSVQLNSIFTGEVGVTGTKVQLVYNSITGYEVLVYDNDEVDSNILKITLNAVEDYPYKEQNPSYVYVDYTSVLQISVTYLRELLAVYSNLENIVSAPSVTQALLDTAIEVLKDINTYRLEVIVNKTEIEASVTTITGYIEELRDLIADSNVSVGEAEQYASIASTKAQEALASANSAASSLETVEAKEVIIEGHVNSASSSAASALASATSATASAETASASESVAVASAATAVASATSATSSAESASTSATNAANSATGATASAALATSSATSASTSAASASTSATTATTAAEEAEIWTQGTEDAISDLGGTYSALTSATLAYAYSNADHGTSIYDFLVSNDIVIRANDGISPTISVGNVSMVDSVEDAAVVNVGTDTALVLDFYLPKNENVFDGTQAEWDTLTVAQQELYSTAYIYDEE